ncbi:hypothetical protein [Actinotalea sp. JY-7876]|uniref:AAA family ATPase n=1 Tax=Actinotalea sp. JY-7876 TaxID=2758442 RepID=UPI0015F5015C|nr:hypothetical protein [Actinotalea sp. JY-7876]
MTTGVLCAVRGPAETVVVRDLTAARGRFEVTRRCADLAELLGAAAAGLGTVAVVSADLPGLDREAVDHLRGSGARVVVLAGDRDAGLAHLGADAVVAAGGDVAQAISAALAAPDRTSARDARLGARLEARAEPVQPAPRAPAGGTAPPGRLVAVWGPTGAPGRTTLAVTLAAELAAELAGAPDAAAQDGRDVLLVDADTYGGTVAQALGLLDESPGLAAASRAATTGRLDVAALAALTPAVGAGLRVLTGLSRAERWPEVPGPSLDLVWRAARDLARWTVVDTGFSLEQDEALSYDTRAPRRNAATLSALAEADVVVVVGGGDPIGLQRLVRALGDLAEAGVAPGRRVVVVNRLRASASGPRPGDAVRGALHRYAGVEDALLVPEDRAACDGALLAGRTLVEHAPSSPVRRAVRHVAEHVGRVLAPVASG